MLQESAGFPLVKSLNSRLIGEKEEVGATSSPSESWTEAKAPGQGVTAWAQSCRQ